MDYTYWLNEFRKATTFDLYRLHVAIDKELESPQRITAIKKQLYPGMELSYFDDIENRLIQARLLNKRRKNALVFNHETKRRVIVPYYMLNIAGADTDIYHQHSTESLTANTLKIGDCVGFNHNDQHIVGTIERLNHKTVSLVTATGQQWRVAYVNLRRVYDAELDSALLPHPAETTTP